MIIVVLMSAPEPTTYGSAMRAGPLASYFRPEARRANHEKRLFQLILHENAMGPNAVFMADDLCGLTRRRSRAPQCQARAECDGRVHPDVNSSRSATVACTPTSILRGVRHWSRQPMAECDVSIVVSPRVKDKTPGWGAWCVGYTRATISHSALV